MNREKPVVIALGGNALLQRGQRGTFEEQYENVRRATKRVADLIEAGYSIAITHGNGPQVGATIIRHDAGARLAGIPAFPMHACGAETQGFIGYMIQQALQNELNGMNLRREVVTVLTRTLVSAEDPAFKKPTKPVGPFYTREQAAELAKSNPTFFFSEDAGRGWRRMVPSPEPKKILEADAIRSLVGAGYVVISAGGGGIPVTSDGSIVGVDAVIDKDLAAERLAALIGAGSLVILTDVDGVYLNYGTEKQRKLAQTSYGELKHHLELGQFSSGSMEPKVKAALRFIDDGGELSIIASLEDLLEAVAGNKGTRISR